MRRGDQVEQSLRVGFNVGGGGVSGLGSFGGAGGGMGSGGNFNADRAMGAVMGMGIGRGGSGSGSPVNELVMPTGLPAIDMFSGSGFGSGSVGGLSSGGGLGGLGSGGGLGGFELPPQIDDTARQVIPQIWKETALLYLHTVVNDSLPGTCLLPPILLLSLFSFFPSLLPSFPFLPTNSRKYQLTHNPSRNTRNNPNNPNTPNTPNNSPSLRTRPLYPPSTHSDLGTF